MKVKAIYRLSDSPKSSPVQVRPNVPQSDPHYHTIRALMRPPGTNSAGFSGSSKSSGYTTRSSAPCLLQIGFLVVLAALIWCAVHIYQVIFAPRTIAVGAQFCFPDRKRDGATNAVFSNAKMHLLVFLIFLVVLPRTTQPRRKNP